MKFNYEIEDGKLIKVFEYKNTNILKQENIQYKKVKKQFRFKNSTIVAESLCGKYWIGENANWLKKEN